MGRMLRIAIVGDVPQSHLHRGQTLDALKHAAGDRKGKEEVQTQWFATPRFSDSRSAGILSEFDGLVGAPWSPNESKEGALRAIRFARENRIPFLAACGGMQHTLIEFARNVLGIRDAEHAEYDLRSGTQVVTALSCGSLAGKKIAVRLSPGTRVRTACGRDLVEEKTTCNYGLNPDFQQAMEEKGFRVAGVDATGEPRAMELDGHPFYVATLYVPQLTTSVRSPHPLVRAFLDAAVVRRDGAGRNCAASSVPPGPDLRQKREK